MKRSLIFTLVLIFAGGCSHDRSAEPVAAGRQTQAPDPVQASQTEGPTQIDFGREGGGGGGIRIDGKVYTFSELGLKLDQPNMPYYPDSETVSATVASLDRIEQEIGRLPRLIIHAGVFSNKHEYKKVEVVDGALFERMKSEYESYLKRLGTSGTFVLAAYTEDNVTYLFPDFFAADPETRAIYMIHESAYFLKPQSRLVDVLRFEIAVTDFLTNSTPAGNELKMMQNKIVVTDGLRDLSLLTSEVSLEFYLHFLLQKYPDLTVANLIGNYTDIEKRCEQKFDSRPTFDVVYETDPSALNAGIAMEPGFLNRFYKKGIKINSSKDFDFDSCFADFKAGALRLSVEFDSLTGQPTVKIPVMVESMYTRMKLVHFNMLFTE